jgi:AcrR family transcriptional regulator
MTVDSAVVDAAVVESVELVPPAVRTLRRDAALNRQRLLDAAERVFAERGLEASVDEVARVAGVGMGTLYRRFPTKDALIGELVRELLEHVLAQAREALAVPDGGGLEQFLYATGGSQASRRGCLTRLWNDPETAVIKTECRTVIRDLLRDAQDHGRVRLDAVPADIDLIFWSMPGVIDTTKSAGETGWRRHLAIMIAGLRASDRPLDEPALTSEQVELIRNNPKVR